MGYQKIMVIHDASRDDGLSAITLIFKSLPLKPGDELLLLGVLHQLDNPMGFKTKVDSSNPRIVADEIQRKKEQYYQKEEVMQLSKQCERGKIKFQVAVEAGPSMKTVAIKYAKSLSATWVVLDRQMKKHKSYFMDQLSCGILRMKRNNTIEQLRGPRVVEDKKKSSTRSARDASNISYYEMIPENRNKELPSKKELHPKSTQKATNSVMTADGDHSDPSSSHQIFTSTSVISSSHIDNTKASTSTDEKSSSITYFQEYTKNSMNTQNDTEELFSSSASDSEERIPTEALSRSDKTPQEVEEKDDFEYSVCTVCKNRRPKIGLKRDFSYTELYEATNGFSPDNFLSEGGFGSVYRGKLKTGLTVAVKQHKDASCQGEKQFKSEVHVLSKARHPNLVMLLGSCSEGTHRLLVYEFVCNGSLDQHLSRHTDKPLSWDERIKIAVGTARGLEYLHRNNIIHRDMRPHNILVTHDHESMVGDFGLARNQVDDQADSEKSTVVGTLGYVAPEYAECGKVSTKTDVYSFGVVILQLITGYKPSERRFYGESLVQWARPLLEEKNYPKLIDDRIVDSHDVHQLLLMVRLAEKCLNKDPAKRLTMEQVVQNLEYIMKGTTHTSSRPLSISSYYVTKSEPPDLEADDSQINDYVEKLCSTSTTTSFQRDKEDQLQIM